MQAGSRYCGTCIRQEVLGGRRTCQVKYDVSVEGDWRITRIFVGRRHFHRMVSRQPGGQVALQSRWHVIEHPAASALDLEVDSHTKCFLGGGLYSLHSGTGQDRAAAVAAAERSNTTTDRIYMFVGMGERTGTG